MQFEQFCDWKYGSHIIVILKMWPKSILNVI